MKNIFFFGIIIIFCIKNYICTAFKTIILNNGNYLIINKKGIYIYDKDSLLIIKSYYFEIPLELENEIDIISYFKISGNEYNYIFILTNNNLYIFSSEGDYIIKQQIFDNIKISYYSINLYKYSDNLEYYYFIEYINSNNNLVIDLYKYNFSLNINNLISSNIFNSIIDNNFSCHLMINSNSEESLICFLSSQNSNDIKA